MGSASRRLALGDAGFQFDAGNQAYEPTGILNVPPEGMRAPLNAQAPKVTFPERRGLFSADMVFTPGRHGEADNTGVLLLRPAAPAARASPALYVAIRGPPQPAGSPGSGGAPPPSGGTPEGQLPPLPTTLTNLQLKAGSRRGIDPLALKLGYFPLPFVEKFVQEIATLQNQVSGLQGQLAGVQGELSSANTWVGSVSTGIGALTGKTYTGASFDAISVIPGDLATMKGQIGAIETWLSGLNQQSYNTWDLFGGKLLADLKTLVQLLQGNYAMLQAKLAQVKTELGNANTWATGVISGAQTITGNTYSPTSFDAVGLTQLPADLVNAGVAIGPEGLMGTLTQWTGTTYTGRDLLSGKMLGDLKGWVQNSMATDVVTLNNLTQKVFGVIAQAARDFIGLQQLHGFSHTTQTIKSQASLAALRPDDFGNMQDQGLGSETAEGSGFDGWEGDAVNIQPNPFQPTQYDAGRVGSRPASDILFHPFARMRGQRAMRRAYDAIPTGITLNDFHQNMHLDYGDGTTMDGLQVKPHVYGAGTFTPMIQPLVQDVKTGKWYGKGLFHNLRNYAFGILPKSVQNLGGFVKDSSGNIYNMGYQVFGQKGEPLDDNANVLMTRRETGNVSDFVTRHVDHKLVKTRTDTVQVGNAYGQWGNPQTLSGLVLAEIDPTTYVPHHNYVTPLRNPRAALKEDY